MTNPDQDLFVTSEDVAEESAAGTRPVAEGEQPSPPVPVDTDESRAARAADTGQQLEAGEG